ncbi:hypothetical protein CR205_08425 [Alteribacter lacisalsi]|uniref:Uncharacterized protein n=1 Tax=Alteribacter lacisalsi TaxID=2045244 RepID=A0A2W0H9S1_9BACI|nr:SA1362 family protein [Alteribacter lacisalsi]PYZ98593.1 hypothetical protein CR205_08425 [Alteribacter lacisalsi]
MLRSFHPLLLVLFALAIVGVGSRLFSDPAGFFVSILVMIGVATLLFLLFRHFIMPRMANSGYGQRYQAQGQGMQARHSGYAQAARKQSPQMQAKAKKGKQPQKKRSSRPLIKRQSDVQLRVIEGKKNKSKKKNRALF